QRGAQAPRLASRLARMSVAAGRNDRDARLHRAVVGNALGEGANMNWPAFFLGCFIVGFMLSALSFALSAIHLHLHINIPFVHHLHLPHVHVAHGGHAVHGAANGVSAINFPTMMAFLAWFGGTGYLLTSQFGWWAIPAVTAAVAAGLMGAAIVFWVMARLLWSPDENMQGADYQMVGVLGRLINPI